MNLVDLILHRTLDTPTIRIAARVFAVGLLFLVFVGAVSRAETASGHVTADGPDADAAHSVPAAVDDVAELHDALATGEGAIAVRQDHGSVQDAREAGVSEANGKAAAHDEEAVEPQGHGETPETHEQPAGTGSDPAASAIEPPAPGVGYTREERLLHRLHYFTEYGIDAWERGDHEEAEMAFAKALNVNLPASHKRDLLRAMAELYEKDGQLARAIAVLEKLYSSEPDDGTIPEILLRLGILYRETRAFDLARKRLFQVLNSTLAVSPESFDENRRIAMKARLEIAETYAMQGDFEEARRYYSRLQRLDLQGSDLERVKFREAQLQHQLEKWSEAAEQFRVFLKEYPQSRYAGEARYLRSKALEELGRRDEAMQEVITLLSAKPAEPAHAQEWAYWQRRSGNELANRFYEQGDFQGALSIYQALARASADPAWRWPALYQIGLCFERLNLPERAGEAYHLIVSPENDEQVEGEAHARPPTEALKALQDMAQWRLGHLDWIENFENRMHALPAKPNA